MAFSVLVRKDLGLVFTEYRDFVDDAQLRMALDATVTYEDFEPGMLELTDLAAVRDTDINFGWILGHHSRMSTHYARNRVKTDHHIVAPTDLGFGLARIYFTLAQGNIPNLVMHLHPSEHEALKAIGRSETSITEMLGQ